MDLLLNYFAAEIPPIERCDKSIAKTAKIIILRHKLEVKFKRSESDKKHRERATVDFI